MATPFWDASRGAGLEAVADGYEGKLFADNEWDFVLLGGDALPGISYAAAEPSRRVDETKTAGEHGSTLTLFGYTPAKVEITVIVWTPAQLSELDDILTRIWPVAAKKSSDDEKGFDIVYPSVNQLHIKSVVVIDISSLQPGPVQGSKQMKIKCREYFPKQKKSATKRIAKSEGQVTSSLVGGSSNYTTPDGKQVSVIPGNAAIKQPSKDPVDRGPGV